MNEAVLGVILLAAGLLLAFRGYAALRAVIAAWAALVGFLIGSAATSLATGGAYLDSPAPWIVGVLVALVFGVAAYAVYALSVAIGMGSIGFALGTTGMAALGVRWSWLIVLAGLAIGLLLAILAIAGELPMVILVVLGAFAGASAAVAGVLLLLGMLATSDLTTPQTTTALELGWPWTLLYLGIAAAGIITQLRTPGARRGTLRSTWSG
ncbi:MAG: DUF4203 domain-containing protein [Actinomycetota bacterium]